MMGNDENCMDWIVANREPKPEGAADGAGSRQANGACGGSKGGSEDRQDKDEAFLLGLTRFAGLTGCNDDGTDHLRGADA